MSWLIAGPGSVPEITQFSIGLRQAGEAVRLLSPFPSGVAPRQTPSFLERRASRFLDMRRLEIDANTNIATGVQSLRLASLDVAESVLRRREIESWKLVQGTKYRLIMEMAVDILGPEDTLLVHHDIARAAPSLFFGLRQRKLIYYSIDHPRSRHENQGAEYDDYPKYSPHGKPAVPNTYFEDQVRDSGVYTLVPCEYAKDSFVEQGWKADTLLVTPLGIPTSMLSTTATDFSHLRPNDDRVRVIFAGRITVGKGLASLIEAAANEPQLSLTICGTNDGTLALPTSLPPNVELLDRVDRANLVFQFGRCDVVALPSYAEGFGYAPLEGMASGLPAIVSSRTFASDHTPSEAFRVVHPGDVQQIIDSAQELHASKHSKQAAHQFATENAWSIVRGKVGASLASL